MGSRQSGISGELRCGWQRLGMAGEACNGWHAWGSARACTCIPRVCVVYAGTGTEARRVLPWLRGPGSM